MTPFNLQVDHVEMFVPDRYKAAAWYADTLGLEILVDFEHWATEGGPLMISADGGITKLALFEGTPPGDRDIAGYRRVAFRADRVGFDEIVGRLGAEIVDHEQALSMYFSDPWGHLLEVTTYEIGP